MLPSRLDPHLLASFVAIAETGSFAAAAQRVGRSEAAVSMQMKRLEGIAGPPALFVRSGRRMRMTQRAEMLLGYARRVLQAQDEMSQIITAAHPAPSVRLGCPEDYIGSLLPEALGRFSRLHPEVEVDVVCEASEVLSQRIAEGQIDLAVVTEGAATAQAGRGTGSEKLRLEPLVWATAPDYAPAPGGVVPLAAFQPGCTGRTIAVNACDAAGMRHWIAYSSPSLSGLLAIVRQGLAVAALARCSVPDDLRVLSAQDGMPHLPPLSIAMLRSGRTPALPAVRDLAQSVRASLRVPSPAELQRVPGRGPEAGLSPGAG